MPTNKYLSPFVRSFLPGFVQDFHPDFTNFMEAFLEYLEQEVSETELGRPFQRLTNFLEYQDLDSTLDGFVDKIYAEYLAMFPTNTLADRRILLKNIKDFYRSRGTEKSFKFLLRALYGVEDTELYYPKNDILIPSSGKWYIEKALRVSNVAVNRNNYFFKIGATTNVVERTKEFYFPVACNIKMLFNVYTDFQNVAIYRGPVPNFRIIKSTPVIFWSNRDGNRNSRPATEEEIVDHENLGGSRYVGPLGQPPKLGALYPKNFGVFEWDHNPDEGRYYRVIFGSNTKDFPNSPYEYSIITDAADDIDNDSLEALELFRGTTIRGKQSGASAIVERALIKYETVTRIKELYLSSIRGTFIDGEEIQAVDYAGNIFEAVVFSGIISDIIINFGGTGYKVGDQITFVSDTETNGLATVAQINFGNVAKITPRHTGAGYRANDIVYFYGGDPEDEALGFVSSVTANNQFHPNNYTVVTDIIGNYANVALNSANYGFPGWANTNANTRMVDAFTALNYGPTGPVQTVTIVANGKNYLSVPTAQASANDRMRSLGVLGRMKINTGGSLYEVGDELVFVNQPGQYGLFAKGNVTNVAANGAIREVKFQQLGSEYIGGFGYDIDALPSIQIISANGTGGNITVTDLIGTGDVYRTTMTSTGGIARITILNRGSGYLTPPTVNIATAQGSSANLSTEIIKSVFAYPGRHLDDTGMPSSYNFLQDRDYYQQFSYVIRSKESLETYREAVKKLLHPAGMKMFGEFKLHNEVVNEIQTNYEVTDASIEYKPSLDLDFTENDYIVRESFFEDDTVYDNANVVNLITITRSSNATYFDANGNLQNAVANEMRFNHDPVTLDPLGLLIEGARTNYVRNPRCEGAVAGTSGTAPTYWSLYGASTTFGISREILGVFNVNGVTVLRVRYFGTSEINSNRVSYFDADTICPATIGQITPISCFFRLAAGSFTGVSDLCLRSAEYNSGGTGLLVSNGPSILSSVGSSLRRYSYLYTMVSASAAYSRAGFSFAIPSGNTVDFTIDIGLPQIEVGPFESTPMLPPVGSPNTATRAAESVYTPLSEWYNSDEGTIVVDWNTPANTSYTPWVYTFSRNASNAYRISLAMTTVVSPSVSENSVTQASLNCGAVVLGAREKLAFTYATNDFRASRNGGTVVVDSAGSVPTQLEYLYLGKSGTSSAVHLFGHIKRLTYYPRRVANSYLQLFSTQTS